MLNVNGMSVVSGGVWGLRLGLEGVFGVVVLIGACVGGDGVSSCSLLGLL